jgi:hypothetical protein
MQAVSRGTELSTLETPVVVATGSPSRQGRRLTTMLASSRSMSMPASCGLNKKSILNQTDAGERFGVSSPMNQSLL